MMVLESDQSIARTMHTNECPPSGPVISGVQHKHVRFNLPTCDANNHNLEEQERLDRSVRSAGSCDSVGGPDRESNREFVPHPVSDVVPACPCCGSKTDAPGMPHVVGSCDNGRWNWNGEPAFCCLCASLKGLGSMSHFGCDTCKVKRMKIYKKTSFFRSTCRNCLMPRKQHARAEDHLYPRCLGPAR